MRINGRKNRWQSEESREQAMGRRKRGFNCSNWHFYGVSCKCRGKGIGGSGKVEVAGIFSGKNNAKKKGLFGDFFAKFEK